MIKYNENLLSPTQFLSEAGLDWVVRELPIVTVDGTPIPKHKALINSSTGKVLAVTGKKYTVYQNTDLAQFAERISAGTNAKVISGGQFKDGRDIFFQLDLGSEVFPFGDVVKNYAVFKNTHDGRSKLAAYPSMIRIRCKNTFIQSYRQDGKDGMSFIHTTSIFEQVEEFIVQVQGIRKQQIMFAEYAEIFSKKKPNHEEDLKAIAGMIGGSKDVMERNYNSLIVSLNDPSNDNIRDSVWGTFNAVTHWGTHNRKIKKGSDREYDSMFGVGSRIKNDAMKMFIKAYAA
jgi:phage/plasmid-like protein (TIGR03299 family)